MLAEGKNRVNKLEEDNAKLRLAVEQSMTRLNRMSMDSDYLVDRLACSIFYSNFLFLHYLFVSWFNNENGSSYT